MRRGVRTEAVGCEILCQPLITSLFDLGKSKGKCWKMKRKIEEEKN